VLTRSSEHLAAIVCRDVPPPRIRRNCCTEIQISIDRKHPRYVAMVLCRTCQVITASGH